MVKEVDTLHLAAFDLPRSSFLSSESRSVLQQWAKLMEEAIKACPFDKDNPYEPEHVPALRQCFAEKFWPGLIARYRSQYDVCVQPARIADVHTEIITPAEAISPRNRQRVLINLHSGGFVIGARYGGQVESIPIAATGKIKVVSIDYRMAPEHRFPAATEDVVAVYRSLLQEYEPENIGLYGCSAGAVLTAQTVAWLQKLRMPAPGAVGMFCGAGAYWSEGDSGHIEAALGRHAFSTSRGHPYFKDTDPDDPLVFPLRSAALLAKFPASLLIAATRDQALSSVAHMHSRLIALGIEAELHVWEGLGHAFFYEPELPQSREMYDVTVKFFDRHLGKH